jgi:hypothetical protein
MCLDDFEVESGLGNPVRGSTRGVSRDVERVRRALASAVSDAAEAFICADLDGDDALSGIDLRRLMSRVGVGTEVQESVVREMGIARPGTTLDLIDFLRAFCFRPPISDLSAAVERYEQAKVIHVATPHATWYT